MVTKANKEELVETAVNLVSAQLTCSTDVDKPIYCELAALLPPSPQTREAFKHKLTALIQDTSSYQGGGDPLSLTPQTGLLRQALYESSATMPASDDRLVIDFEAGSIERKTLRGKTEVIQPSYGHTPKQPPARVAVPGGEDVRPLGRSA